MKSIEERIRKAIETRKLNLEISGERNWHQFFIRVTELVWSRNFHDGYQIEVYDKEHGNHLTTIRL